MMLPVRSARSVSGTTPEVASRRQGRLGTGGRGGADSGASSSVAFRRAVPRVQTGMHLCIGLVVDGKNTRDRGTASIDAGPRAPAPRFGHSGHHQHDLCQAVDGLDEMSLASLAFGRRPGGLGGLLADERADPAAGASAPPSYGPLRPRGADRKKRGVKTR